jgi:hypothetical protein
MASDIINQLKEALVPHGTMPVVRLFLKDQGANYFNHDFVTSCINEFQKKSLLVCCELEEFTPLEKLAMRVLFDSAYIDLKDKP